MRNTLNNLLKTRLVMRKTFKIIMLDTKSTSIIHKRIISSEHGKTDTLEKMINPIGNHKFSSDLNPQHLYIISDEEIKEEDWVTDGKYIYQLHDFEGDFASIKGDPGSIRISKCKKIVATTDKSLHLNDGRINGVKQHLPTILPQIPQSFIEAYVKAYNEGKPITEVDLEYKEDTSIKLCDCYYTKFCQSTQLDKGTKCRDFQYLNLKTRKDNTVIIHQSRMYSREEVIEFGEYLMKISNSVIRKNTNMTPLNSVTGPKLVRDLFDKWINNL